MSVPASSGHASKPELIYLLSCPHPHIERNASAALATDVFAHAYELAYGISVPFLSGWGFRFCCKRGLSRSGRVYRDPKTASTVPRAAFRRRDHPPVRSLVPAIFPDVPRSRGDHG